MSVLQQYSHLTATCHHLLHLLDPLRRCRQILIPILRHQDIIYTTG